MEILTKELSNYIMIAQKLKNNKIVIANGSARRKDAIQTIEDLKLGEFFRLTRAARNWDESLNDKRDIMFTRYESTNSKVCKEFDGIYERRELWAEAQKRRCEETEEQSTEALGGIIYTPSAKETRETTDLDTTYMSRVIGTSKLVKIPSKQVIKIARRKGASDCRNKPTTVCIDNKQREEFFFDCKASTHYKNTKQYELMYSTEDKSVYEKWDAIISKIYKDGLERNTHEDNQT